MPKKALVTGLASFWGAKAAQHLVDSGEFDVIVGVDSRPPHEPIDGVDFIVSDQSYSSLARLVKKSGVDTIVHSFLVLSTASIPSRSLHEINVIGTMNLLAAAGQSSSKVTKIVVKSSSLIYGSNFRDPAFFTETTPRSSKPKTEVESSLIEAESYIQEFAEDNPYVDLCVLRFPNVLGPTIESDLSQALIKGMAPVVFGFDPLLQFVHEDEVLRVIDFVMGDSISGVFNVAAQDRIPWSRVYAKAKATPLIIPPFFTAQATALYRTLGVAKVPSELVDLLTYGRGIDGQKLRTLGYKHLYTTEEAVNKFAEYTSSLKSRVVPRQLASIANP